MLNRDISDDYPMTALELTTWFHHRERERLAEALARWGATAEEIAGEISYLRQAQAADARITRSKGTNRWQH